MRDASHIRESTKGAPRAQSAEGRVTAGTAETWWRRRGVQPGVPSGVKGARALEGSNGCLPVPGTVTRERG